MATMSKDSKFSRFTVVLERDMTESEMKPLMDAISQMRGVSTAIIDGPSVETSEIIARHRAKEALREKVLDLLYNA